MLKARFTRHRYELHTHPTYVVALVTAGCERVRVGGRRGLAPAGTVVVVNPEECHDGEAGADDGWAYRTFYPAPALMMDVARELGLDRPPMFARTFLDDEALARAVGRAHESSAADDPVRAEQTMLLALRELISHHGDRPGTAAQAGTSGAPRRVLLYEDVIEADLGSALDLKRLAAAAGVTRFQVIRDFKRQVGLTPAAFIRNRRLRRARRLIELGASLSEAAAAAGFADQSHLTRTFNAVHGITPGIFQKAHAGCPAVPDAKPSAAGEPTAVLHVWTAPWVQGVSCMI